MLDQDASAHSALGTSGASFASRKNVSSVCCLYPEEGYHFEVGIENGAGSHKGCTRFLDVLVLHASESKALVPNLERLETQFRLIGFVQNLMRELIPNFAQNVEVRPNGVCRQAEKARKVNLRRERVQWPVSPEQPLPRLRM